MKLRMLLLSLLPTLLVAPSLAATITVNPGDNVSTKVQSAHPGDTVLLSAGTYTLNSPLWVPSGITLTGVSPALSHMVFNVTGTDTTMYGLVVAADASNVTIEQLDISSNHGDIAMGLGSHYTNIVITHNNFQYGDGQCSNGCLVFGISGTLPNDGLQITHNYFHDSPQSYRNWTIFYPTNANFDYNQFYNVNDGGEIVYPGPNVSFSCNYGTHIHRMGQEVSLDTESTFTCSGNVFYDYVEPYYDTEGVSIVGPSAEVNITNNFFQASIAAGSSYGQPDGGGANRFGFAIEATGQPCDITGNTFVGYWANCVCSDIPNANVSNNNVFGWGLWGDFDGEWGPLGIGSCDAVNNSTHSLSAAPIPPANTFAGPQFTESPAVARKARAPKK